MNQINKNYVIICCFISLGLNGYESGRDELISLLDQIVMAKRYWTQVSYCNPFKRAATRPLPHWITTNWNEEIPHHLTQLTQEEKNIAHHLGTLVQGSHLSKEQIEE